MGWDGGRSAGSSPATVGAPAVGRRASAVAPSAAEEEGAVFRRSERNRHRADLVRVAVDVNLHGSCEVSQAQAILPFRGDKLQRRDGLVIVALEAAVHEGPEILTLGQG